MKLKNAIWRLTLRLKRKRLFTQLLIFYVLTYIISFVTLPILLLNESIWGKNDNGPDIGLGIGGWITVAIIAPLLETFVFQKIPFKLMQKWNITKNRYGLYILISALFFGLSHWYSSQYIIFTFFLGLVLGYIYVFYSKTPKTAFWIVTLIHCLRNTTSFLLMFFTS